mmetsp:Transcript_36181/g.108344  ORF Transcript_36181/g.108344 Transcript_36181/m.108344 type:complete len:355 (+) Transcript_36181:558-1622(+)
MPMILQDEASKHISTTTTTTTPSPHEAAAAAAGAVMTTTKKARMIRLPRRSASSPCSTSNAAAAARAMTTTTTTTTKWRRSRPPSSPRASSGAPPSANGTTASSITTGTIGRPRPWRSVSSIDIWSSGGSETGARRRRRRPPPLGSEKQQWRRTILPAQAARDGALTPLLAPASRRNRSGTKRPCRARCRSSRRRRRRKKMRRNVGGGSRRGREIGRARTTTTTTARRKRTSAERRGADLTVASSLRFPIIAGSHRRRQVVRLVNRSLLPLAEPRGVIVVASRLGIKGTEGAPIDEEKKTDGSIVGDRQQRKTNEGREATPPKRTSAASSIRRTISLPPPRACTSRASCRALLP